jgi:hypothetical protein
VKASSFHFSKDATWTWRHDGDSPSWFECSPFPT